MLPPIIFNFLQLCSFEFSQIRPLKASKYRYQITALFSPELAVLVSVRSYVQLRTPYLKRSQPWAYIKHAAHNLTFPWSFHSFTIIKPVWWFSPNMGFLGFSWTLIHHTNIQFHKHSFNISPKHMGTYNKHLMVTHIQHIISRAYNPKHTPNHNISIPKPKSSTF